MFKPHGIDVVLAVAGSVIVLLAGMGGCRPERDTESSRRAIPKRVLPNIIFLTVDTLRADHLAMYGYHRNTMPSIEAFARDAIVFDNAVVPRGSTRPSYASILTGLYPFRHGVRSNHAVLHDDLVTLPETLRGLGYHTAGFVSNFVLIAELSGCDQGFDVYDDRVEEREAHRTNYQRTATHTLAKILEWLENDPPQPFFLFTNFIDPHGPYQPPDRFRKLYHTPKQTMLPVGKIPRYQREKGVLNFFDYLDRYDAEIRYTDEALGILIDELKAKGVWDDALVVFTADHGEAMGEHGQFFEHHMSTWQETTRVPLVIRPPRQADDKTEIGPARIQGLCSPMDLYPTVMAFLDEPPTPGLDGRDIMPLVGGTTPQDRTILIEFPSVATAYISLPDVYAVRTRDHKLIRTFDPKTGRLTDQLLFELAKDPLEQKPIKFDQAQSWHRNLGDRLDAVVTEIGETKLPFTITEYRLRVRDRPEFVKNRREQSDRVIKQLSDEQIEKLRSLGYVD